MERQERAEQPCAATRHRAAADFGGRRSRRSAGGAVRRRRRPQCRCGHRGRDGHRRQLESCQRRIHDLHRRSVLWPDAATSFAEPVGGRQLVAWHVGGPAWELFRWMGIGIRGRKYCRPREPGRAEPGRYRRAVDIDGAAQHQRAEQPIQRQRLELHDRHGSRRLPGHVGLWQQRCISQRSESGRRGRGDHLRPLALGTGTGECRRVPGRQIRHRRRLQPEPRDPGYYLQRRRSGRRARL